MAFVVDGNDGYMSLPLCSIPNSLLGRTASLSKYKLITSNEYQPLEKNALIRIGPSR